MDLQKVIVFYYQEFFSRKNIAAYQLWKNDSMSKEKLYLWSLLGRRKDLYAFDLEILKNYDYALIVEPTAPKFVIRDFKSVNPNIDIKCWMTNIVSDYGAWKIRDMQQQGVDVFSFDPSDCKKYGLRTNHQSYPFDLVLEDVEIKRDCYYCAKDKNRMELLLDLQKLLEKENLSYQFDVVLDKDTKYRRSDIPKINVLNQVIDYEQMAKNIKASRCVVEIVQKGQLGMTRRPLEAVFYNKKLITNNPYARQYSFYKPENIYIIGGENIGTIGDFMRKPMPEYSQEVRKSVQYEQWLRNFWERYVV